MSEKSIHRQIREKLEAGDRVFSMAVGRIGEVVACREGDGLFEIEICSRSRYHQPFDGRHRHLHAATSFNVGDRVELHKLTSATWSVHNA